MDFPDDARRRAGFELRSIQQGDFPSDFKPMSTVGKGVEEIRIRTDDAYRIFYVARFEDAVYVLHSFQKKTQKTSRRDTAVCRFMRDNSSSVQTSCEGE
ncbi:type II toxin-antitoxin system RelE/ParE family toxin [Chamaesiphon sp. OTE_75_metabat_556]|uniref:type II toxin-antitoxin system RelE/ParE family toxin n=1 Tax=Chamaesiphon sp. OTE_75_metabat_556 TaxID=2964692 RepID=UPI00286C5094|nr:type II toxin-antitoxin system RelE/ParE family toxin [Chamaesiphon sp. OTE_75_metabat_556]